MGCLNIVCTSKPCDGLLYYSYEYCCALNEAGIETNLIIITRGNFKEEDYINSLKEKYIYVKYIHINDYIPNAGDVTLILGRNMLSIPYENINEYNENQRFTLHLLFDIIISVYSEQNVNGYAEALKYFNVKSTYDLCDHEVYLKGVGEQFEKIINFEIYQDPVENILVDNLFLGTNKDYYITAQKLIDNYDNYGIVAYDDFYVDKSLNNLWAPVKNLLGTFNTYVYCKEQFDPAPRIIQECRYYNINMIYERDKTLHDGGYVYWNRDFQKQNLNPILKAYDNVRQLA